MEIRHIIRKIYVWVCMTIIIACMLGYAFYQSIDGVYINVPLTFKSNIIVTEKQVYKTGEPIAIKWEYCKGVDTVSDISITLVDGIVYFLPQIQSNREKGCYNSFTVVASVPDAIPTGNYKLNGVIRFRVNAFKNIDYQVESNFFRIEDDYLKK